MFAVIRGVKICEGVALQNNQVTEKTKGVEPNVTFVPKGSFGFVFRKSIGINILVMFFDQRETCV
ncbi:MAG: hypothetical protein CVU46_18065 [Chloroflexi bacterium HGW-Chloroflexi-8]|nr:MAG: hypothetical protein CVU46_18065 [Chloroflexi bacterium HGW-Chloroflexi-8]